MNRMQAVALIQYLNRCVTIIPTTGGEWDAIRSFLPTVEAVANGQYELVQQQNAKQQQKPQLVEPNV